MDARGERLRKQIGAAQREKRFIGHLDLPLLEPMEQAAEILAGPFGVVSGVTVHFVGLDVAPMDKVEIEGPK